MCVRIDGQLHVSLFFYHSPSFFLLIYFFYFPTFQLLLFHFLLFFFILSLFSIIFFSYFQAQTYAAEAAGVLAENAKVFVAEKMEKVTLIYLYIFKSKYSILSFFFDFSLISKFQFFLSFLFFFIFISADE